MSSAELENLVKIGKLKREPPSAAELQGLYRSAVERLADLSAAATRLRAAIEALPPLEGSRSR